MYKFMTYLLFGWQHFKMSLLQQYPRVHLVQCNLNWSNSGEKGTVKENEIIHVLAIMATNVALSILNIYQDSKTTGAMMHNTE